MYFSVNSYHHDKAWDFSWHISINGTEKVHGRQLDLLGVRQGKRQVKTRERREKDTSQMDLFGESKAYLEERGYQLIKE